MAAVNGRVLIYGGKGALGNACVALFKSHNWWVGSIDMFPNEQADGNVEVKPSDNWVDQSDQVYSGVEALLNGQTIDAIICVAGGWAGGNASDKDFIKNSDLMWKQSVWTSTIAAQLGAKHLKPGGFLSLTGAKAALEGTSGMIGYGLAKAAVHQLVRSLGEPKSGLPENATVVAILPVTLDTPMNRKFMPKADHSSWTPLEFVAKLMYSWTKGENLPKSGSLVQLVTSGGETELNVE